MSSIEKRSLLIKSIVDLNEEASLRLINELLQEGVDPVLLVQDCQSGMKKVGERYESKQYFLAGLIMGGEIFSEAVKLIRPVIVDKVSGKESGVILIGTVAGDIHDLGKNMATMLLRCHQFTVYDIGVDISPETFLKNVRELNPGAIGLSGLITAAFDSMRNTIKVLRENGIQTPVIIGGATVDEDICHYTGADYWVASAEESIALLKSILKVPYIHTV